MSSQQNTYVMIGAIFPYELFKGDEIYDKLEPYTDNAFDGIHNHKGICVLFDGMNGEYVAIGYVLAKSDNHEGLEAPVVINGQIGTADIKADIQRFIGDIVALPEFEVTPIALTHYR
jgi:hypothetical protein